MDKKKKPSRVQGAWGGGGGGGIGGKGMNFSQKKTGSIGQRHVGVKLNVANSKTECLSQNCDDNPIAVTHMTTVHEDKFLFNQPTDKGGFHI